MNKSHKKTKINITIFDLSFALFSFIIGPLIFYLGYVVLTGSLKPFGVALAVFLEALLLSFQALLILHLYSKVFLLETLIELLMKTKSDKSESK